METTTIVFLYILLILFDFIPTIKRHKKNQIWAYSVLLSISLCIVVIKGIRPNMPSIDHFITMITEKFFSLK